MQWFTQEKNDSNVKFAKNVSRETVTSKCILEVTQETNPFNVLDVERNTAKEVTWSDIKRKNNVEKLPI